MSGNFGREVTIHWDGQTGTYIPSMAMLARMERKGINIHSVGDGHGGYAIASLVVLCAEVMREAGLDVVDDDLYAEFRADMEGGYKLFATILASFTPEAGTGKKLKAPRAAAKKAKKAPSKKA